MGQSRFQDGVAGHSARRFGWQGRTVLVTGATGSFGSAFVRMLLETEDVGQVRIASRDELKQWELRRRLQDDRVRMFVCDIRDAARVRQVMRGVDVVIHAAALKQVPVVEANPMEAIKTNVLGSNNVFEAAVELGVERLIALSSDKACSPTNHYGITKAAMERLAVVANAESAGSFSCVRYGNVTASRGSAIPLFLEQRIKGVVTLTDPRMTRFWITVNEAVRFVKECIERQRGGEVFVPMLPSVRMTDVISVVAPGCRVEEVGIRPGEKLHELLLSEDESRHTLDAGTFFVVTPEHSWWRDDAYSLPPKAEPGPYSSGENQVWLTPEQIAARLPAAIAEARPYDPAIDATVSPVPA